VGGAYSKKDGLSELSKKNYMKERKEGKEKKDPVHEVAYLRGFGKISNVSGAAMPSKKVASGGISNGEKHVPLIAPQNYT
jgi:hypothetical protein